MSPNNQLRIVRGSTIPSVNQNHHDCLHFERLDLCFLAAIFARAAVLLGVAFPHVAAWLAMTILIAIRVVFLGNALRHFSRLNTLTWGFVCVFFVWIPDELRAGFQLDSTSVEHIDGFC